MRKESHSVSRFIRSLVFDRFFRIAIMGSALSVTVPSAMAANFQWLGSLPSFYNISSPQSVSFDGSVIVGRSYTNEDYYAFRWTEQDGLIQLPFDNLAGDFESITVSSDGLTVYGINTLSVNASKWTEEGGLQDAGIPFLPYLAEDEHTGAITAFGGGTPSAMRWSELEGFESIGSLSSSGNPDSEAYNISGNGLVIVGRSRSENGYEAYRWTEESGMVGLGYLGKDLNSPGLQYFSRANGVSEDGSVIVGATTVSSGNGQAFRWNVSSGMVSLGTLPGFFNSEASSVSGDGSKIVGRSFNPTGYDEAFFWDSTVGIQPIAQLLQGAGVDTTGWNLIKATAISGDGSTIVGVGLHDGKMEAWMVRDLVAVPEPYTIGLLVLAGLGMLIRHRPKFVHDKHPRIHSRRSHGTGAIVPP